MLIEAEIALLKPRKRRTGGGLLRLADHIDRVLVR